MSPARKGLICLLISGLNAAFGQTLPMRGPTFDAASVKPYDPASTAQFFTMHGGPDTNDPGRFTCRKCTLANLLLTAFDIKGYQLAADRNTERFDLEATVPGGASRAQFLLMLQNLLIERFKLNFHHELRDMTTYRLDVGKNGPKLVHSPVTGPFASDSQATEVSHKADKDGFPDLPPGAGTMIYADVHNTYRLGARNVSMRRLAEILSSSLKHPVTDATGLQGEYDFKLLWAPDFAGVEHHQDGSAVQAEADADSRPTIQQALQKQLGLSLESSHGQVDVLVIDRAERVPTEN